MLSSGIRTVMDEKPRFMYICASDRSPTTVCVRGTSGTSNAPFIAVLREFFAKGQCVAGLHLSVAVLKAVSMDRFIAYYVPLRNALRVLLSLESYES